MTMGGIHEFAHRVEQGDRVIAVQPQKQPQTQSGGFFGSRTDSWAGGVISVPENRLTSTPAIIF